MFLAIGPGAVLPQPARCQGGGADGVGRWLTAARDGTLRGRCEDALASRERSELWQLARRLGPGVTPSLWRLLGDATKDEARWRLLTALAAAGGDAEDDGLLRWAGAPGRSSRDRAFVALLLALGPVRRTGDAQSVFETLRGPSDFAVMVAACAAARFPAAANFEGTPATDVGVLAALAYAGAGAAVRAGAPARGDRREPLWWQGMFLRSAVAGSSGLVRERAMALRLGGGADAGALRAAAWRCAALAGDASPEGERPEPLALEALAADERTRARFRAWFDGVVAPLHEHPERLAVAQILAASPTEVEAAASRWRGEVGVAGHVALAVAWRIAGGEALDVAGGDDGAWAPVAVARRRSVAVDVVADAPLRAALTLRTGGRLADEPFRGALADALWRWGSHPALATWRLERTFVRDLVLAGSQAGAGKYQPHVPPEQRNLPEGIGGSDPWFEAAVAAYEFFEPAAMPMPAATRLAR